MFLKQAMAVILVTALATFGCSCSRNDITRFPGMEGVSDSMLLTRRQLKKIQPVTVQIRKQEIMRTVICQGLVVLPASSTLSLSAPIEGTLRSVVVSHGSYVRAGTVLAEIASEAFLDLQQDYLVKKSLLKYHEADFRRKGELTLEDASSIRELEKAEAGFRTTEADFSVLGKKLALLGIVADTLHIGNVSPLLPIIAPVSGYLSAEDALQGSFVSQGKLLFRITDNRYPALQLMVPELFTYAVHEGLSVRCSFRAGEPTLFTALVKSKAFQVDPASATLTVKADVVEPLPNLLPGRSVYATLETGLDSAYVIPAKAVIHAPEGDFLMILEDRTITMIRVETQAAGDGLAEIVTGDETFLGMDFVIGGTGWTNLFIR